MITLDGLTLTIEDVISVARYNQQVKLHSSAHEWITESRNTVEELSNSHHEIYGITTGFGELSNTHINTNDMDQLQRNLILSHACGVGTPLPTEVVRAMMILRINSLIKGYSGIREETIQLLLDMLNKHLHPIIPSRGSLGASGDLIPLAHMALAMIGEGKIEYNGETLPAAEALKQAGLTPITLKTKEGLALINGTQFMTALACLNVFDATLLLKHAQITGAMALEALKGTDQAFRREIHDARPHPGQIAVADNLWRLTQNSAIIQSHKDCNKVQDAYTLRCMPQVFGATHDVLTYAKSILAIEINSATDNPLILPETTEAISGGNFHGQTLAYVHDFLGIAVSEIGNILERQIARLLDTKQSGLPAFLIQNSGLNSGYMLPHYTAAALLNENKILSHPASTDSIPTSANKEDHVSMGANAGLKAQHIITNTKTIIAIHFLLSTQALDFHRPLTSSPPLQAVHQHIRSFIDHLENDRYINEDLNRLIHEINQGTFLALAQQEIGCLN